MTQQEFNDNFTVVWSGSIQRAGSKTKGELLGSYDSAGGGGRVAGRKHRSALSECDQRED